MQADAHPQAAQRRALCRGVAHRRLDACGGAAGVQRLVGVGAGCAPEGHHRVADELVDRAAFRLDRVRGQLQEPADDGDHPVAQLLGQAGEAGKVGEQHRDLAPLAAGLGPHAAGHEAAHEVGGDELGEVGQARRHPHDGAREPVDLPHPGAAVRDALELEPLDQPADRPRPVSRGRPGGAWRSTATRTPTSSRKAARPITRRRMVGSISARNSASGTITASCQPLNQSGDSPTA